MITIDPITQQPNLPGEGQPSWFFIALDLEEQDRRDWAEDQAASAAVELDLADRENGPELQAHLADVFLAASSAPRPEGFSARCVFIPDTSTWGVTVDVAALIITDDEDQQAVHRMLTSADEAETSGGYLAPVLNAAGHPCGLLSISVKEDPLVEFEGGGAIVPTATLTCVVRRPDPEGVVVDLIGMCVTQDIVLLALALEPIKDLLLGDELFSE